MSGNKSHASQNQGKVFALATTGHPASEKRRQDKSICTRTWKGFCVIRDLAKIKCVIRETNPAVIRSWSLYPRMFKKLSDNLVVKLKTFVQAILTTRDSLAFGLFSYEKSG